MEAISTFVLIVAMVFGFWKIYQTLKNHGPAAMKRQRTARLFPTYVTKSMDFQSMMVAKYVSVQENADYYKRHDSSSIALDFLLEKLDFDRDNGPFKISATNQSCDISEFRCSTLYELTVAFGDYEGQVVYMTIDNWKNPSHYTVKPANVTRERYEFAKNKKGFIEDYYFNEKDTTAIKIGSSAHMLIPNTLPVTSDPIVSLLQIMENAKVQQKEYEDENEGKSFTRMYYLHDDGDQVTLRPKMVVGKALSSGQVDAIYAPFEITYQNEKHKVKASAMIELMATQLYHGGNVFLSGVMGTGKTSFMQLVMNRLSEMEDTLIVNVMPSLVRGLKEMRAQTQFTDALGNIIQYENNTRVIVFLDEGESMMTKTSDTHSEDNTFVASLLDGEIKKIIQCATAITFNANRKDLNPILFRSGRAQMLSEVKPLAKADAANAVRAMKMVNIDKIFDEARYNHYVDIVNKSDDGKEYCPAGFITLADISGCFIEKDVASLMIEAIRGESIKPTKGVPPAPVPKRSPAPPPPAGNVVAQSINDKMRALKQQGGN